MKGRMYLSFAAADHRLLSRRRFCALDGRGDLSLVGSASRFPPHPSSGSAPLGIRAAVLPASAQHQPHLQPFAAPSRSSAAAGHRAFYPSGAAVLLCAAGHRSLSQDRLCGAPPHGGSVLRRFGSSSFPAALCSPLGRRRMGAHLLATAEFSVLSGAVAVRLACAKSHRSPLVRSHFSIVLHKSSPNPAVNRTLRDKAAQRRLL